MSDRPRILVAEDDPELLTMIASAVELLGADVACAHTGAELVLALAKQGPFDLVITDIAMPWMNGLQAMRSVRFAGVTAPIIFITASSDARLPEQIAALGGGAVLLRKPFDFAQLESAIHRLLDEARANAKP